MNAPAIKPYLYADELALLIPWTVGAIRKKVQRGELRRGVHYFQEARRGRLIFKWSAVCDLIESRHGGGTITASGTRRERKVLDVAKATAELRRLLG